MQQPLLRILRNFGWLQWLQIIQMRSDAERRTRKLKTDLDRGFPWLQPRVCRYSGLRIFGSLHQV